MFGALFLQLLLLIGMSFIMQRGPMFVYRIYFGFDFHDLYVGASDWLKGVDPYLRGRLYTPPSSLSIGLLLAWLPFSAARLVFFLIDVLLVFLSLRTFARDVRLTKQNELALMAIVTLFYPFYFLIERGNLDGVMLALLIWGFRARSAIVRWLMLGVSMALKLYSGLFAAVLLRKKKWLWAISAGVVALLLQLPFLPLVSHFLAAVTGRSAMVRMDENLSPATFFYLFLPGLGFRHWGYFFRAFWAGTLGVRLFRDKDSDMASSWPLYVPWLMSYPALVFPYSGVLALPLFASIVAASQSRHLSRAEQMVLAGFGLLGFQAVAWTDYLWKSWPYIFHLIPSIGVAWMILGAAAMKRPEPVGTSPSISRLDCVNSPNLFEENCRVDLSQKRARDDKQTRSESAPLKRALIRILCSERGNRSCGLDRSGHA